MSPGRVENSAGWNEESDPILAACADRALGEPGGNPDPWDAATVELELAAASLELALMQRAGDQRPMPEALRARILSTADQWISKSAESRTWATETAATTADRPLTFKPVTTAARPDSGSGRPLSAAWTNRGADAGAARAPVVWRGQRAVPWLLAAASLILAGLLSVRVWREGRPASLDPAAARSALLASAPDVVRLDWQDWDNPEIKGVKGDVIWSDSLQKGYMRLVGLPKPPSPDAQFQLWIIDGTRGMEQRISGGIFDCPGTSGEIVIPIDAKLFVRKAAAFALTIENRGGTWVSDMKRRVVIAKAG